jgi:hypothetical protein
MRHRAPARCIALLAFVVMASATGACASILGYDAGELATDAGGDGQGDVVLMDRSIATDGSDGGFADCIPAQCPPTVCGTYDSGCGALSCSCSGNGLCDDASGTCTCTSSCNGRCGNPQDPCSTDGGVLSCGGCPSGMMCSGFQCMMVDACVPLTCADYADSGLCGSLSNSCGNDINCGLEGCQPSQTTCQVNACCAPASCPPNECGSVSDNCGGTTLCDTCEGGTTCNVATPMGCCPAVTCYGTSGSPCDYPDLCSGEIVCTNSCNSPNTCGGGGTPNECGCSAPSCNGFCGEIYNPCTASYVDCLCDGGQDADADAADGCSNPPCPADAAKPQ